MDRTELLVQLLRGNMDIQPIHPGEILREDFLLPMGKSPATLERELGLQDGRVVALCQEWSRVDGCLAILLANALGTTPVLWSKLQERHDRSAMAWDRLNPSRKPIALRFIGVQSEAGKKVPADRSLRALQGRTLWVEYLQPKGGGLRWHGAGWPHITL